ncbi:MAG: hypothetical protein PHV95_01430 [Eubacteriales bacterium]|nr:hypothetical protein [Eubacteriales bacterium]
MKKAVAFILVLTAITSILSACTPSDVISSISYGNSKNNSSTLSESLAETSAEDEISDVDTSFETSSGGISNEITMKEFFTQTKYMILQDTVFKFISAYERADKDAALELVADPAILESYFPTDKKSMDDMLGYHIVNVTLDTYEKDGNQVETASLVVSVAFDNDSGAYEFLVNLDYIEYTVNIGGTEGKAYKWLVKEYNLTT